MEALMGVMETFEAAGSGADADKELVRRAARGELAARDELYRRHRHALYMLALQLLGNSDDALDVVQDTMLRFFGSLHRFDLDRPVRPWLFRIVRNCVLDLFRRRKVRQSETLEKVDADGETQTLEIVDPAVDLERDLARTQLRRRLWLALGQLNAAQREIVVLRDYQDLSYNEIAETLAIPVGTVMSRLHSARQRLRHLLGEELRPA